LFVNALHGTTSRADEVKARRSERFADSAPY